MKVFKQDKFSYSTPAPLENRKRFQQILPFLALFLVKLFQLELNHLLELCSSQTRKQKLARFILAERVDEIVM